MSARAYYNEFDPYAAQWLRNLIAAGHLPPGDVDERSIVDVAPADLAGYTQCHFFAGIGGWSYAARLAGWPDARELWTGSAPCQPFSVAGAQRGTDDERHLWPHFLRLIAARRPAVVFGEQVANAAGAKREKGSSLKRAFESLARERPGTLESYCQIIKDCQSGREHDRGCEEAREAERLGLRFGGFQRAVDGANQLGAVRTDRDATQTVWRPEGLGYAVTRSDRAGAGLHDQQCSGDRVRPERDDADLGTGSRHVDYGCTEGQGSGAERELSGEVRSGARASAAADWLDGVQSDLHALGYTCGAAIVPCCAVDAPHRRDRLWFVAHAAGTGRQRRAFAGTDSGDACGRAWDVESAGLGSRRRAMADAGSGGRTSRVSRRECGASPEAVGGRTAAFDAGAHGSHWRDASWIIGHDGKARRVEPSIRLLAHGVPARVGRLRAYGNAIVPALAANVIGAYMDCHP